MHLVMKQQQPVGPAITCTQVGCSRGTKHGKTYCSEHIDCMDYAQNLAHELERRERETLLLAEGHRLPRDSHLVREAFALLWEYRSVSAPGLTRHIHLSHDEAVTLLRSLADHGLATLTRSSRGLEAVCTYEAESLPVLDAADA